MARAVGVASWRSYRARHAVQGWERQSFAEWLAAPPSLTIQMRNTLAILYHAKLRVLELEVAAKQARR